MKRFKKRNYGLGWRLAVIADVHGNLAALRAVLEDIKLQEVTWVINLGDCLSGPLDPAETASLLMRRNFETVRGNHDRALVEQARVDMGPSDAHAASELNAEQMAWLKALPPALRLRMLFACHGTPTDDNAYWLDTVGVDGRVGLASRDHIERHAAGISQYLILCAHTHIPRAVQLEDGRLIVNPGSVGCPGYVGDGPVPHVVETGTPHASYAIIEEGHRINWEVAFRLVGYDAAGGIKKATLRNRPDWASALATGRVTST